MSIQYSLTDVLMFYRYVHIDIHRIVNKGSFEQSDFEILYYKASNVRNQVSRKLFQ